jgi:hypothetical protein
MLHAFARCAFEDVSLFIQMLHAFARNVTL